MPEAIYLPEQGMSLKSYFKILSKGVIHERSVSGRYTIVVLK